MTTTTDKNNFGTRSDIENNDDKEDDKNIFNTPSRTDDLPLIPDTTAVQNDIKNDNDEEDDDNANVDNDNNRVYLG